MTKPSAKFSITVSGLSVTVSDTSTNTPTTWVWSFGDGGTANTQNPGAHTYSSAGIYFISLKASNEDGGDTCSVILTLNADSYDVSLSLKTIVQNKIPVSVYDDTTFNYYAKIWQNYLKPQTDPELEDSQVYDETKWGILFNALIAELVVYEFIKQEFTKFAASGNIANSDNDTNGLNTVKKLEVGPSNAEWYNTADSRNQLFKTLFGNPAAISRFETSICTMANRLGVILPFCPIPNIKVPFIKAGRTIKLPYTSISFEDLIDPFHLYGYSNNS